MRVKDFTATVTKLQRLQNSINANPRFRVTFDTGAVHMTQSDASFCYAIENPEMKGPVDVWLVKSGKIEHMAPAQPEKEGDSK